MLHFIVSYLIIPFNYTNIKFQTTILQLLLKELSPQIGYVDVNGSFSYSSQEPWLFVATVRNNILFGLPYNHRRYKEVVTILLIEFHIEICV